MTDAARILIVEDEPRLRSLLRLYLEREGYEVTDVGDGRAALDELELGEPDLVILDLMLPGMQGDTVLEEVREQSDVPVLITSAKRTDAERIAGLRLGADDYLVKPFNPHELTARVAAILRRASPRRALPTGSISLAAGRLVVDPVTRRFALKAPGGVSRTGRLTPAENRLLAALVREAGRVLTREQLLEVVTRRPGDVYDRVIDVHVANLRRKVDDDASRPWLIETVSQVGYRLVAERDRG